MATTTTKTQLARLAMARLRQIAPNETLDADDLETIELEIDLCKSRIENTLFGGVSLWTSDSSIPYKYIEGFLLCLLPQVASHYQAITTPINMTGEGLKELARQLTVPYDADTVEDTDSEDETIDGGLY